VTEIEMKGLNDRLGLKKCEIKNTYSFDHGLMAWKCFQRQKRGLICLKEEGVGKDKVFESGNVVWLRIAHNFGNM
jgi:hypothetical protein